MKRDLTYSLGRVIYRMTFGKQGEGELHWRVSHMDNLQTGGHEEELVPISQKYMLTVREASSYFNIGIKSMRRLCESNEGRFSIYLGNRYLICRQRFEEYLDSLMAGKENQEE